VWVELLVPTVNELDLGSCRVWSADVLILKKKKRPITWITLIEHQLGEAKQFSI
jgi:hypothetical protein